MGFPREHRLISKTDYQSVFANPCKITYKYLLALYRSNSLNHARLGIIVSKHHAKRAVQRNCFKRVVRESFRLQQDALKGLDIIILLRSECTPLKAEMGKQLLRTDVDKLWQRLINSSKHASST